MSSRLHPVAAGLHVAPSPGVVLAQVQKQPTAGWVAATFHPFASSETSKSDADWASFHSGISACCSKPDQLQTRRSWPPRRLRCNAASWKCFSSISICRQPACRRQPRRREPPPALRAARPRMQALAGHRSRGRCGQVFAPVPPAVDAIALRSGADPHRTEAVPVDLRRSAGQAC